jgi:hypothetical protein
MLEITEILLRDSSNNPPTSNRMGQTAVYPGMGYTCKLNQFPKSPNLGDFEILSQRLGVYRLYAWFLDFRKTVVC